MSQEQKAKPENKPEAKPETQGAGEAKAKEKKISKMSLAEVDQKLKAIEKEMGGFQSDFARHLLARKRALSASA